MKQQEVAHWQSAMSLYREALRVPEETRQHHLSSMEISPEVQAKLKLLFSHTQVVEQDPLQTRLDDLVSRFAGGRYGAAGITTVDEAMTGRTIGGWIIQHSLGRGGMAAVFKAKRSGVEFEQLGALKLLSLLLMATGGRQRFVREQQFLAQLHHPNIAMLLDGGLADDGTPFLVTELVDGCDIQTWCKQQKPDARTVVQLLLQVCAAVSHAHGQLILHRDIKPSNVLVTTSGQVKLVDFGIGKLLAESSEGAQTRIYSPKYAAPEQVRGAAVTTATDVYGLGALATSLLDSQLASHRELKLILDKATRPEAERRYTSVEGMARDLQCWLSNRPVHAVGDSAAYRLRKFARRNLMGIAAGMAVFLTAAAGVTAVAWQAEAARIEARKATTLATFMTGVFASGDLLAGSGPQTPIGQLMEAGGRRARTELNDAPAARAEMLRIIGLAQTEFGEYEEAGDNLQVALESAIQPVERARVLGAMGVWAAERAEFAQGIAWMEQALAMLPEDIPPQHPDRLEIELNLINFLLFTGEHQRSLAQADRLLAAVSASSGLSDTDQANLLRSRGMALTQNDRFNEAINSLQKAIALTHQMKPPRPALTAAFLNDLGNAFTYAGNQSEAIDSYMSSFEIQTNLYGPAHKRTLTSGSNLVHAMRAAGMLDNAISLGQTVLESSLSAYGEVNRSVVLARFALALALSDAGQHEKADQQMVFAIEALRQLDDMRTELPNHLAWLGEILIRQGRFSEAVKSLEEAENLRESEFPDEARRYRVAAQQRLAQAHAALGDCEAASAYMTNISSEIANGNPDHALATELYLLNCLLDSGQRQNDYQNLLEIAKHRNEMNASLQAALNWAKSELLISG